MEARSKPSIREVHHEPFHYCCATRTVVISVVFIVSRIKVAKKKKMMSAMMKASKTKRKFSVPVVVERRQSSGLTVYLSKDRISDSQSVNDSLSPGLSLENC